MRDIFILKYFVLLINFAASGFFFQNKTTPYVDGISVFLSPSISD